jgi:hypothetical protein
MIELVNVPDGSVLALGPRNTIDSEIAWPADAWQFIP